MKLAYTIWTWQLEEYTGTSSRHLERFEEAIRSIKYLGYDYVEDFNFIVPWFIDNPEKLKAILDKYDMKLVNLYHTYYYDGTQETLDKWLDLGDKTCRLLKYCGAKQLNLQGNIWQDKPFFRPDNPELIDAYIDAFMKMGRIAKDYGIQACLHPHGGTAMFSESQIDYFIEHCDMDLVRLTMDTAHTALAGMDPCYAFNKYAKYISYVHLKDIDPDESLYPEWPMKRFCAPGQGYLDFRNIIKTLENNGYDGVVCIENDYPTVCSYESAQSARNYMRAIVNM